MSDPSASLINANPSPNDDPPSMGKNSDTTNSSKDLSGDHKRNESLQKASKEKARNKILWGVALGAIIATLVFGILLVVFFEALLPKITQTVIDNSSLRLDSVSISEPTEKGFNLNVDTVLVRKTGLPAHMHDTYLKVFLKDPNHAKELERMLQDEDDASRSEEIVERYEEKVQRLFEAVKARAFGLDGFRRNEDGDIELGVLHIPATDLEGYETKMAFNQTFEFTSQKAFDHFTVQMIELGSSPWRLYGTTDVTVLGKKVNRLDFDKIMNVKGPSFMEPLVKSDDEVVFEDVSDAKEEEHDHDHDHDHDDHDHDHDHDHEMKEDDFVAPKVTGLEAVAQPDGRFQILTNMTVTNSGKASLSPIGVVGFDVTWNDMFLGGLATKDEISIFPGENEIELVGLWDLSAALDGLAFFELVKAAKQLNNLRAMFKEGDDVVLTAKGTTCSIPLYEAAVQAITTELHLKGFKLDLMEQEPEDVDDLPPVKVDDDVIEGQQSPREPIGSDSGVSLTPRIDAVQDFLNASEDVQDMPILNSALPMVNGIMNQLRGGLAGQNAESLIGQTEGDLDAESAEFEDEPDFDSFGESEPVVDWSAPLDDVSDIAFDPLDAALETAGLFDNEGFE